MYHNSDKVNIKYRLGDVTAGEGVYVDALP